jgi:Transposase domain (DUF772)
MPPDVRDWPPEGHLAWFVLDAVEAMDLTGFYASYRQDGHGRAAYEPSMMVALLLYAYARGVRSSRAVERACEEDIAYRVIAANQRPDHATLARFMERHEEALAGLFSEGPRALRRGRPGEGWGDRDRRHEARGQRQSRCRPRPTTRSPGRFWSRRGRPTRPRTSSLARPAAMSCRRTYRPTAAGVPGCATPRGPDGAGVASRGSCRDVAGNVAVGSFRLNDDATPPPAPIVAVTPGQSQGGARVVGTRGGAYSDRSLADRASADSGLPRSRQQVPGPRSQERAQVPVRGPGDRPRGGITR